jgi:hypothetical protein
MSSEVLFLWFIAYSPAKIHHRVVSFTILKEMGQLNFIPLFNFRLFK